MCSFLVIIYRTSALSFSLSLYVYISTVPTTRLLSSLPSVFYSCLLSLPSLLRSSLSFLLQLFRPTSSDPPQLPLVFLIFSLSFLISFLSLYLLFILWLSTLLFTSILSSPYFLVPSTFPCPVYPINSSRLPSPPHLSVISSSAPSHLGYNSLQ